MQTLLAYLLLRLVGQRSAARALWAQRHTDYSKECRCHS